MMEQRETFGLLRVAAASPWLRVADCAANAQRILALLARAEREGVALLVFPELCLTGYTCGDLFQQQALQHAALAALDEVREVTSTQFSGIAVVGLPLTVRGQLFNTAAVLSCGRILGVVPKSFLPNYKEFYERRWFAPAQAAATISDQTRALASVSERSIDHRVSSWRLPVRVVVNSDHDQLLFVPVSAD